MFRYVTPRYTRLRPNAAAQLFCRLQHERAKTNQAEGSANPSADLEAVSARLPRTKRQRRAVAHQMGKEQERASIQGLTGPTVLIFKNASEALTQEDFNLLLPKGKHIEGWRSYGGLMKAVPARDPVSLRRLNSWILLFSSPAYAASYSENLYRVHGIAKEYMPQIFEQPRAPLPGFVSDGEDIPTTLREYTLLPPSQKLDTTLLSSDPRLPSHIEANLARAEEWSQMTWDGQRVFPIRFCVEGTGEYVVTRGMIREMIAHDGKRRGKYWNVVLDNRGITRLDPIDQKTARVRGEIDELGQQGTVPAPTLNWMIMFLDENEAKRFVRYWHRRPFQFLRVSEENNRSETIDTDCLF